MDVLWNQGVRGTVLVIFILYDPTSGEAQGVDLGGMVQSYGRKFVHADSGVALQYYMLASVMRGNSIAGEGESSAEGDWEGHRCK